MKTRKRIGSVVSTGKPLDDDNEGIILAPDGKPYSEWTTSLLKDQRDFTRQERLDRPNREKIINKLFALCTDPKFTYVAWQCSQSDSPDIVGLTDMPQFQMAVDQILALIPDVDKEVFTDETGKGLI